MLLIHRNMAFENYTWRVNSCIFWNFGIYEWYRYDIRWQAVTCNSDHVTEVYHRDITYSIATGRSLLGSSADNPLALQT